MRPAKRENQKTRKPENQKTGTLLAVFAFSRFRVSRCSHLRASLIASLIDCNMLLDANTAFLLSPFSGLRVFAVFGFSPISRFRGFRRFRRFRVFGFSPFSPFSRFRRFRVHRLIPPVFAFLCFHMFSSWRFRATECTASVHTLHMPKALTTFVFIVLRNGLRQYIFYTCPKV